MGRRRFSRDGMGDELPDDGASVDLAAVRRDDALIDAISGTGPVETATTEEYELATLLADWRAEILAEPMPAGPDLDEVVAAVHRELGAREALSGLPDLAERRSRTKAQLRLIRPLAGAAALIAVAIGGGAAVSYGAEPGDPLWGVKQVVFSEQAQSTEARIDTTSSLQRAEELIAEGNTDAARELLTSAESRSTGVTDATERDELGDWLQRLATELNKLVPPPPAPGLPQVPVPPAVTPPVGEVAPPPALPPDTVVQQPVPSTVPPAQTTAPASPTPVDPTIADAPSAPPPSNVTTTPGTGTPVPSEPGTPTAVPTTPSADLAPPTTTASSRSSQDVSTGQRSPASSSLGP